MTTDTAVAAIFGWLLGLLGPLISDAIRKRYREREVREGIYTELLEVRSRLAAAVFQLESHFGGYNRALLEWVIPILESSRATPEFTELLTLIRKQAALDDQALAALAAYQTAQPGIGLHVKKYRLPYVDSKIGELGIFSEAARAKMLDIRAQLDVFNEEVDEARMYHKMTFDHANSESNHMIACANVDTSYKNLAKMAKRIVDHINSILPGSQL